jgi:hypothetical protein
MPTLAWIQYQHGSKSEYYLLLLLAEEADRYVGLLNKEITDMEAAEIRRSLPALNNMVPGEQMGWLRANVPSFNKAYREFRKDRSHLDKSFDIKPLEGKQ